MAEVTINNHIDPEVMLYGPDGNEVGLICNVTALDDVRLQIYRQHLTGYYFVYNSEKIHIDSFGNVEKWPDGCFDYVIKAAGDMLDVSGYYKAKKAYVPTAMEEIKADPSELLAHSGHSNHGHETACAHGAHAWFCDDDDGDD
jgi:hypothetical protein